ncbi:adhesive plaque matrix protein [Solenopsis invicta]|uniref:adhesive plaque matrix protein n=1 Tax=Solenopsis invicta TaxID=13686 RepID=UPI00193E6ADE|nr:adhesive plaque matrix protein [Solenopsis invicta]XP_011160698.2 adhesive plaque matrix protein [Solenopsis invicta]
MTHPALSLRRLSLALTLITICATITESSMIRERRHIEESSHRSGKEHASDNWDTRLPSSTAINKITAEPGRKVSHHLIGGHLRVDTNRRDDGESLWDDGILMSAAGNGKEGKSNRGGSDSGSSDDEDGKKTLSQQVKEGKYGLIQNEIYGDRPKRPGIISYLGNPEVPKDTIDNLGGLDEDEIWLAENHVLVLRGGKFPEHEQNGQQPSGDNEQPKWPPIDDYNAPKRQVKIPSRPKIPPPFPVQLTEGGPVQLIGPNGTAEEIANGTLDYNTNPLYTKGLLPGEDPFFAISPNGTAFSVEEKSSRGNSDQKGIKPELPPPHGALPPFYHAIPPGAIFVPPPGNQSDYDEEDQSIYYPPPYSFYYPQDNTTAVPPGPLVPGIILPPPPDFFSALDDKKTTTKKYTKRPTTTSSPATRPTYLPPRKLTTKQNKASSVPPTLVTKTSTTSSTSTKISFGRATIKNVTDVFKSKQKTTPRVQVTTSTSGKPHTLENTEIYTISPVIGNQVSEATTQQKDWSTLVSSKTIPVLAYYPSTTQSSTVERPVEVTPASIKSIITSSQSGQSPNHASYYFYEESTDENSDVTAKQSPVYYESTTKSPYYNIETSYPHQTEQKKHYYAAVETIPPVETSKDYKVKLIDSIVKNSQTFQYTDDSETTSAKFDASSSRDQSQRMLADAPVYYHQPIPARPLQTYYTTPKPQTYYRQTTKPKPVYQYSFQVADYSKQRPYNGEQQQQQQQQQQDTSVFSEYQDVKSGNRQYDYEDIDSPSRHQLPRKQIPYKTQHPVYSTSTAYPIVDTTPNPQYAYFTQQDEKLLDDVTKEYFTIFGKKLPDAKISSTTPIYGKSSSVTEKPEHNVNGYVPNVYTRPVTYKTPSVKVRYGDQSHRPYSLKDDTRVNYRRPLPPINPDSEFIEIIEPPKHQPKQPSPLPNYGLQTENYRLQNQGVQQHRPTPRYRLRGTIQPANRHTNNFVPFSESREELENIQEPVSLLDDIEVNYKNPRPPINPDAEFIDPVTVQDNQNAYFAYQLPGDVGHFYFLTPQAITQRQDQNGGYVYPKPRGPRLRRRPG